MFVFNYLHFKFWTLFSIGKSKLWIVVFHIKAFQISLKLNFFQLLFLSPFLVSELLNKWGEKDFCFLKPKIYLDVNLLGCRMKSEVILFKYGWIFSYPKTNLSSSWFQIVMRTNRVSIFPHQVNDGWQSKLGQVVEHKVQIFSSFSADNEFI